MLDDGIELCESKSLADRDVFCAPRVHLENALVALPVDDAHIATVANATLTLNRALLGNLELDLDLARAFLAEDAKDFQAWCLRDDLGEHFAGLL